MEEFEKLVSESFQNDLLAVEGDATGGADVASTEPVSIEESTAPDGDSGPGFTNEESDVATAEGHHSTESDPAA